MSDTPETDKLAQENHIAHPTVWAFCRKFERERDDAIGMMKRTRDNSGEIIASQANENILLTEQRDKLTDALECILGIGLTGKTEAKAKKALQNNELVQLNQPERKHISHVLLLLRRRVIG